MSRPTDKEIENRVAFSRRRVENEPGESTGIFPDRVIVALDNERRRLRAQVNDLQSGMYINCVYCGHRYGPRETTEPAIPGATPTMGEALAAHVATCPKHPMSALKSENDRLRAERTEVIELVEALLTKLQGTYT